MAARLPSVGQKAPTNADNRVGGVAGADPVAKTRGATAAAAVDAAAPIDRTAAVEATAAAEEVAAAAPVAAASRAAAADRIKSIAERLSRGTLTASQAVEELIEDAVKSNLPGISPDSPLTQELRTLLATYAANDPHLASRISRLGIHR